MRKLQLSTAGKWYIILTILIGVVAIVSGNNIFYFSESILLSGMTISGILSELSVRNIFIERREKQAIAGEPCSDTILIQNNSIFPAFCLELCEYNKGKEIEIAVLPFLGSRARVVLPSRQAFAKRGVHQWNAFTVSTGYPFGFARKIRIIASAGKRIIWPSGIQKNHWHVQGVNRRNDLDSIKVMENGEDIRRVIWPLSAKKDEFIIRVDKEFEDSLKIILNTDHFSSDELEKKISSVADQMYQKRKFGHASCSLVIIENNQKEFLKDQKKALDRLSTVRQSA